MPRNVVPKPIQKRTPGGSPRAAATITSPRSALARFARFINPEEAQHWMTDYYDTLAASAC
jgi:hypothetical protein